MAKETSNTCLKYEFEISDLINEGRLTMSQIQEIKTWIPQANLSPQIPEEMIAVFLNACLNDTALTKYTLKKYVSCTNSAPHIFDNIDMELEDMKSVVKMGHFAKSPVRTDDNCAVFILGLSDPNYKVFNVTSFMKLGLSMVMVGNSDKTLPVGVKAVLDFKNTGFKHIFKMKLEVLQKFFQYIQDATPMNIVEIHFINPSVFAEKFMILATRFLDKKLVHKLKIHSTHTDMENFSQKFIPKKCLPKDYGGELPSMEELTTKTIERIRELKPFFQNEQMIRKQCFL